MIKDLKVSREDYEEAIKEMFNAARCALWHVTEHPNWRPCEGDKCPCENYDDAMEVLVQTQKSLLNKIKKNNATNYT